MKFRERWRLAGIMAGEVRFRGYLDSNPTSRSRVKEDPDKMINSLKSASKISTLMSTIIIAVMAVLSVAMAWDPDMPGTIGATGSSSDRTRTMLILLRRPGDLSISGSSAAATVSLVSDVQNQ